MRDAPAALAAENHLLIAAARADDTANLRHDALDWHYLQRAADRQGVLPLLYQWLQRHPDVVAGAKDAGHAVVLEALHEAYWRSHFRNRLLFEELQRIAHAAADAGIVLMPLKGAVLAPHFYATPALRPLSDVDLLVQPRDVRPFGELLRRMGYEGTDSAPSYVDDEWLDLDSRDYCYFATRQGFDSFIEYRVAPLELAVGRLTDLDAAYTDALRRHAREVWARARPAGGGGLVRQSPEDLLLHVATHLAAKHVDFRLIWLHDLARIVIATPDLDWEYIADRSAALRVAAPVVAALDAARRHLGAPVAAAHLDRITGTLGRPSRLSLAHRDLARLQRHVAALPTRDLTQDGPWVWPLGAALSRVRGWPARLRVLRWVLLPGREYLEHRGTAAGGPLGRITGSLKRLMLRLRAAFGPLG